MANDDLGQDRRTTLRSTFLDTRPFDIGARTIPNAKETER